MIHSLSFMMCYLALLFLGIPLARGQVRINEVMFNPGNGGCHNEFLEIINIDQDNPVNLTGWSISYDENFDLITDCGKGLILQPGQYGIIFVKDYQTKSFLYEASLFDSALVLTIADASFGSRGLANNIAKEIGLIDNQGNFMDSYVYTIGNKPAISDERIHPTRQEWMDSCKSNGTPGKKNSVYTAGLQQKISLKISPPVFSNIDFDVAREILIEVRLPVLKAHISLRIYDLRGVCVRILDNGVLRGANSDFHWDGRNDAGYFLGTGMYIIHLEACNGRSGFLSKAKALVVFHSG